MIDGLIGALEFPVQHELHAPSLIDYEMLAGIRKLNLRRELTDTDADALVASTRKLQIARHEAIRLGERMWSLRDNFSMYDGAYVALAEALGVPLMTTDLRLARAASAYCKVVVPKSVPHTR